MLFSSLLNEMNYYHVVVGDIFFIFKVLLGSRLYRYVLEDVQKPVMLWTVL